MSARLYCLTELYQVREPKRIAEDELSWEAWLERTTNHGYRDPGLCTPDEKKVLPCYAPTRFNPKTTTVRSNDVEVISVLILDFDENPDKDMLHQAFRGYAFYAHTTVNHTLEKAKWRIMLPLKRDISPTKDFSQLWMWAQQHAAAYGLIVDKSCKNPDRKWLYPYRTRETYEDIRGEGELLCPDTVKTQPLTRPDYSGTFLTRTINDIKTVTNEKGEIVDLLQWMRETPVGTKLKCFCPLLEPEQRKSCGAVGFRTSRGMTIKCGAHHHEGHKGTDLYFRIGDPNRGTGARPHADINVMDLLEKKVDRKGNVGNPESSKYNILTILSEDPHLKKNLWFNEFTGQIVYNDEPISDETAFELNVWIERAYFIQVPKEMLWGALLAVVAKPERRRNPLTDYLYSLKWDGKSRLSTFAEKTYGAEDGVSNMTAERWLIQAAKRALVPGCKADGILVLWGPQGLGKSTSLRLLTGDEYFSDTPLNLETRQVYIQVQSAWVHELGELAVARRSDVETIKTFTAAQSDTYVPPYGRTTVTRHRRAVFAGTTNEMQFLVDDTGNRRFYPVQVKFVDMNYIAENRDQIWAEAVHRAQAGDQYWLDNDDIKELSDKQEINREQHPWEDTVTLWVNGLPKATKAFNIAKVLEQTLGMEIRNQSRSVQIALGKHLSRLGCKVFQLKLPRTSTPVRYYTTPWATEDEAKAYVKQLHQLD